MVLPIPFQGVLKCLYFVPEKTLAMTDVRKLMSSSMAKKMEKVERFVGEAEKICSINQVAPNVQLHEAGRAVVSSDAVCVREEAWPKFENMEEAGREIH